MANEKRLIDANRYLRETKFQHGIYPHQEIFAEINRQPTVDAVEVVHGRWNEKQEPISWCEDDVDVFFECSICGTYSPGESPYCPNCGAKMRGNEE